MDTSTGGVTLTCPLDGCEETFQVSLKVEMVTQDTDEATLTTLRMMPDLTNMSMHLFGHDGVTDIYSSVEEWDSEH